MEKLTVEQAMDARITELEQQKQECDRRIKVLKEQKKKKAMDVFADDKRTQPAA